MSEILWRPSDERVASCQLSTFAQRFAPEVGTDYESLHSESVARAPAFWRELIDFAEVLGQGWDEVVDDPHKLPGATWFPQARLNFAENLLRVRDDREALVFRREDGLERRFSYGELYTAVARMAGAMHAHGVRPGDRVAGIVANSPEAVIAALASAWLGASWSSCSPDFGASAIADRLGQLRPKVLFAVDGYRYAGKQYELASVIEELDELIADVDTLIRIPYLACAPNFGTSWEAFERDARQIPEFAQLPFDHPLYVLFSSGTTGRPKGIVHGAGGTLVQHLKELRLHTDLRPDDTIFYFTTCGWMMWNWLISSLAVGARVVLYDGSPMYPRRHAMFQLIEDFKITVFGTSAKYLASIEKLRLRPAQKHDLRSLRSILSTGSPLLAHSFDYVYEQLSPEVQLASISGGTDIVSCFALGCPWLPVRRGELQCRGLGMDVVVLDELGAPVVEAQGELACANAFPSMPVGFWDDPDGSRYREAYFSRVPGYWCHGDHALLTERGSMIIYGRSDATLNPGGVRIGTAEIYRQVEQIEEVVEAVAIGQQQHGDERIVLFVRLREGIDLSHELEQVIRQRLRTHASPRHVPAVILQVPDLPRTLSGKVSEIAVREIVHGREIRNREALANPDALVYFADRAELSG